MYSFILLNIARLFTKPKVKLLHDLCTSSTLFICICESFLFDCINDSKIYLPDFTVIRCDRISREGGGVCIYLRNSILFKICLQFSNTVCELLIVRLQTPALISILVYCPPSCSVTDFEEILLKIHTYVMLLPSPLPTIIMLGDFNLPDINWSSLNPRCPTAGSLFNLTNLTFLTQQVTEPTRNSNILDLIFCPDNIINSITVSDTILSDHHIIYADTLIPVIVPSTAQKNQSLNLPSTRIETLDFTKANWPKLKESLNTIDWPTSFRGTSVKLYLQVAIDSISEKCTMYVPPKRSKRNMISRFHRERKIIMRKKLKLVKSCKSAPSIKAQLVKFEKQICDRNLSEKLFEEKVAVTKINEDPNYFFSYAKKFSICKTDIGPLLNCSTNSLINDKYEMCCLLVDQFTGVFTTPDPNHIVTDPVSFFALEHITDNNQIHIHALQNS